MRRGLCILYKITSQIDLHLTCIIVFFNVFLRDLRDAKQKTKSLEKRITTGFSRLFVWCARLDSNQRPSGSEPNALST